MPLCVTKGTLVTISFFKMGWIEWGVLNFPGLVEGDPKVPSLAIERLAPPRRCSRVKSFSYVGSEKIGCASDSSNQVIYRLVKLGFIPGGPRDLPVHLLQACVIATPAGFAVVGY